MPILKCKIFQNHKKFKIIHLVTNERCTKSLRECQSIVQEKKIRLIVKSSRTSTIISQLIISNRTKNLEKKLFPNS